MTWLPLTGDSRLGPCATAGCGGQPAFRLEGGGVASNYCSGCREKIDDLAGDHLADCVDDDCWQCGGEGFISDCFEEWACIDPDGGCDLCTKRCDICNVKAKREANSHG